MFQVILVTPTYKRPDRMAQIDRFVQEWRKGAHKANARVISIFVEDAADWDPELSVYLRTQATDDMWSFYYQAIGPTKDKGNVQRNLAYKFIRELKLCGVVYNADDDNWYDAEGLINEFKKLKKRVGVFPIRGLGPYGVEMPIIVEDKVIGFSAGWMERKFPVDMGSFVFNAKELHDRKDDLWTHKGVGGESEFIETLASSWDDLQPLCDARSRVMAWHNKPL